MDSHNKPTLDLAEIREAAECAKTSESAKLDLIAIHTPALCDEVERLRKALAEIATLSLDWAIADRAREALES